MRENLESKKNQLADLDMETLSAEGPSETVYKNGQR
jgi:hypothetical protein